MVIFKKKFKYYFSCLDISLIYTMHSFPFGNYKDEFGKNYLLHSSHIIIFNTIGDRRQTNFYLNTIFGNDSKKAKNAMEFGKFFQKLFI
jgi:hypothetical protein